MPLARAARPAATISDGSVDPARLHFSLISRLICLRCTSFLVGRDRRSGTFSYALPSPTQRTLRSCQLPSALCPLPQRAACCCQYSSRPTVCFSFCGRALKMLLICNAAHQTDSVACGKWHVVWHRCTPYAPRPTQSRPVTASIRQFGRSSFALSPAPLKLTITYRNMQQQQQQCRS